MDRRVRRVLGVAEKRIPAPQPLPSQGGGLATAHYAAFAIYAAYAIAWTFISCRVNPHTNINGAILRRIPCDIRDNSDLKTRPRAHCLLLAASPPPSRVKNGPYNLLRGERRLSLFLPSI